MALTSNTSDNEDIEGNVETDDESTDTTETNDEDTTEPDDESTTSNQHQLPMQSYGMNVNLLIPTLLHLNSLIPSKSDLHLLGESNFHYNKPLL
eukprot:1982194-Ditylum_brightwellii.AAC.1